MFDFAEGGVVSGFDEIERSAEKCLEQALSKVEDALNEVSEPTEGAAAGGGDRPEVSEVDPYRRFGENMYQAHVDQVENKEIRQWQRAFPYYRIKASNIASQFIQEEQEFGEGVVMLSRPDLREYMSVVAPSPPPHEMPRCNSLQYSRPSTTLKTPEKVEGLGNDLVVTGKQCEIHMVAVDADTEAVDEQQGILEEVLALNFSGEEVIEGGSSSGDRDMPISPNACHREEVVAALIEAVWPECVETLRPMVERVVHLSRQNKLEYRMNEEADSAVSMKEREGEGRVDGDAQGFMVVEVTRGRASSFDSDW